MYHSQCLNANHIKTQQDFLCLSMVTSFGCVNFFLGSSNELLTSFLLLVSLVCLLCVVSLDTSIVAGVLVVLRCGAWGVVGLGVYLAITAWEDSLTSSGETAFEALMSLAVVQKQIPLVY